MSVAIWRCAIHCHGNGSRACILLPYDGEQRLTRVFDSASTVTSYPEERSRVIWQDHDFPPLPLLDS